MILLVYDLRREGAGIEVRYETTNLAAIDLKDAYAVVGNSVAVRGTLRNPFERRPLLGGEDVAEGGLHLTEGLAVLGPELAQAIVTPEGLRHRDVAHLTVVGVDFDQGLDVPVLLQLPQSLDEVVRHFFGHKTTSRTDTLVEKIPFASSSESRQDNEPQDASQSAAILILPNVRDDRIPSVRTSDSVSSSPRASSPNRV